MKTIEIKNRKIGINHQPVVIAEIGINHGGSLKVAIEMVDAAKKAGVEIIKHQTHIVEDEMSIEAKDVIPGNSNKSIYQIMQECSLREEEELELMRYVEENNMIFMSSPFSRAALMRLIKFEVPAIKIGSGECNNYPLLEIVAEYGKPTIISTGMNSIDSIQKTVEIFHKHNTEYALLHTTNLYPTPTNLVRLGALKELQKNFPNTVIGLSDHTLNNHACFAAVALGASILERHFTDTMKRKGPDIICSMNAKACKDLITGSKEIWEMRGGRKIAVKEEQVTIDFAFASICAIRDIKKGEKLTTQNIWVKRPGKGGIPAEEFNKVLGKTATVDIIGNTQIKRNQFD